MCVLSKKSLLSPSHKEFLLYFLLKILWLNFDIWVMMFPGSPDSSACKESACNVGDLGSIPGLGISPGEGNGNPIRYSCLENSMEQRNLSWWAPVHGVAESQTQLNTHWLAGPGIGVRIWTHLWGGHHSTHDRRHFMEVTLLATRTVSCCRKPGPSRGLLALIFTSHS